MLFPALISDGREVGFSSRCRPHRKGHVRVAGKSGLRALGGGSSSRLSAAPELEGAGRCAVSPKLPPGPGNPAELRYLLSAVRLAAICFLTCIKVSLTGRPAPARFQGSAPCLRVHVNCHILLPRSTSHLPCRSSELAAPRPDSRPSRPLCRREGGRRAAGGVLFPTPSPAPRPRRHSARCPRAGNRGGRRGESRFP